MTVSRTSYLDANDFRGPIVFAGMTPAGLLVAGYAYSPVSNEVTKLIGVAQQPEQKRKREFEYHHRGCNVTNRGQDYDFHWYDGGMKKGFMPLYTRKITRMVSGYDNGGPKTLLVHDNDNRMFAADFDIKFDQEGNVARYGDGIYLDVDPEGFVHFNLTQGKTESAEGKTDTAVAMLNPGEIKGFGAYVKREGKLEKYSPVKIESDVELQNRYGDKRTLHVVGTRLPLFRMEISGNSEKEIAREFHRFCHYRLDNLDSLSVAVLKDEWNLRAWNKPELLEFVEKPADTYAPAELSL